jgi:hypothetical protein
MGQITQPRGPVDRRPRVVVVVAELDFACVQPDAHSDRRQWYALQVQCTGHRVTGFGERSDKAIALTLFERSDSVVACYDSGNGLIQPVQRDRHLLWTRLPQQRGSLDVSQQQCHRAGRQRPAHAKLTPVHQRRVHTRIGLRHANQHAVRPRSNHPQDDVGRRAKRAGGLKPSCARPYTVPCRRSAAATVMGRCRNGRQAAQNDCSLVYSVAASSGGLASENRGMWRSSSWAMSMTTLPLEVPDSTRS